ncbi:MAG: hypothetical protein HC809_06770 [Gammaproteobacteria bacterium]|nr:hypothetical protein [Gammaproteobacteria bacterium]
MLRSIEAGMRRVEAVFSVAFGADCNPWYQLGALSFFFFWLATVTGIYLFIFFDTSITGVYASVERITHVQWYAGGVMRSLHRYASGAMVITVTLHLLRELVLGRFRDVRIFSWVSGVPCCGCCLPPGLVATGWCGMGWHSTSPWPPRSGWTGCQW